MHAFVHIFICTTNITLIVKWQEKKSETHLSFSLLLLNKRILRIKVFRKKHRIIFIVENRIRAICQTTLKKIDNLRKIRLFSPFFFVCGICTKQSKK